MLNSYNGYSSDGGWATLILIGIVFAIGLGLMHLVTWLVTKGIIWVTFELFNINWYGKFWVVYVGVLIFNMLFKGLITVNNKK
jgi:hypothetical protein